MRGQFGEGSFKNEPVSAIASSFRVHGPVRPGAEGDAKAGDCRSQHVRPVPPRVHPRLGDTGGIGGIPGAVLMAVRVDVMPHAAAGLLRVILGRPGRKLVIVSQSRQAGLACDFG